MAKNNVAPLRYKVLLSGERIAECAALTDAMAVCHRYAIDPEYKGINLYVRDTYRWDLPVVATVAGGSLSTVLPSNVVPLRPNV